jgi:hypothetical protein
MKKLKLTKKQYESLVKAGLIKESMNIVDKQFKKGLAGKNVRNLKYVPEEKIVMGSKFNINKPLGGNIHEEVNRLLEYIYGLNEDFSTFWENYNLTYEDLCETLESKGYLVRKEGAYKVSKKMGDAMSVKEGIAQTLSEMLNPIEEYYPAGAEFDSRAPYNQQDPKIRKGDLSELEVEGVKTNSIVREIREVKLVLVKFVLACVLFDVIFVPVTVVTPINVPRALFEPVKVKDVAVAAPKLGVVRLALVARTKFPDPVLPVQVIAVAPAFVKTSPEEPLVFGRKRFVVPETVSAQSVTVPDVFPATLMFPLPCIVPEVTKFAVPFIPAH